MIAKTTLAAAAIATAITAQPVSVANAGSVGFQFGVQTDHGFFSFGNGGHGHGHGHGWGPGPGSYDCWEARQKLKWNFKKVHKIECHGKIYTFKVRKKFGPWRIVKFHKWNGNYWYA